MLGLLGSLLNNPITKAAGELITAPGKRRAAQTKARAKLAAAKAENKQELALKVEEWETIAARGLNDGWKDEYVTLVLTAPLVAIMIGSLIFGLTGDTRLLDGVERAMQIFKSMGIDMGNLIYVVVLAAIGFKALGRR